MARRFSDAIAIQSACNLHGITKALDRAISECKDEGITDTDAIHADPAVRLIVAQMAHLTGQAFGFPMEEYMACTDACEKQIASERTRNDADLRTPA